MSPCLVVQLQAFLLGELEIAATYRLKACPSILVWRDPWCRQIAWSFLHTLSIIQRVNCSEEYRLSSFF